MTATLLLAGWLALLALLTWRTWRRERRLDKLDGWWHNQIGEPHRWTPDAWYDACHSSQEKSIARRH